MTDTTYVLLFEGNSTDNGFAGGAGSFDVWIKGYNFSTGISSGLPFGGSGNDFAERITAKNSGGYIFTGNSFSSDGNLTGNYGSSDIWIMSLQSNLSVAWSKHFGGSGDDRGIAAYQLADGNIMIFGNTQSSDHDVNNQHGINDVFVIKLNSLGDTLWTKTYGGTGADYILDAKYVDDTTFVLVGVSNSSDGDFVFRDKLIPYSGFYYVIDENGNYVFGGSLGTMDETEMMFSDVIIESPYHAMAFGVTYTDSIYNCSDIYQGGGDICLVDFNGMSSVNPYLAGGANDDGVNFDMEEYVKAAKINTNQYAFCTNTRSTTLAPDFHGVMDVWLSFIEVQHVSVPEAEVFQINVHPNPAENIVFVDNVKYGDVSQYEILDIQGKLLLHGQYNEDGIDISGLEKGMYLLKIKSGNSTGITQIVKQ
ncbi:hypothetical protein SDC9_84953 [bioreactor metagenome]|uniref:Secretion system C-terminal sorting domain-containing protein n=1 Tax=bioreactor metagenome TaxID=1076179 RepID=A0A644ZKN5_9ZZZZ